MAYIPVEHQQYDILPNSRKGNWEVVSYDGEMLETLINFGIDISYPYQPKTLDLYYNEIDQCIKIYSGYKENLLDYKKDLIVRNNKLNWGILKYKGKSNSSFTNGRYYYVPIFEKNGKVIVDGIIDDEEFAPYVGWDFEYSINDFEIILDPFGILKNGN